MSNHLLTVIVLAVLIWTFVDAPALEPTPRSVASRAIERPAVPSSANSNVSDLQTRQPPVRNLPAMLVPPVASESGTLQANLPARDDSSGRAAARAAVEADGYKGVTMLGRSADGTWRAKAYRGTSEVQLIVDEAGRVSAQ